MKNLYAAVMMLAFDKASEKGNAARMMASAPLKNDAAPVVEISDSPAPDALDTATADAPAAEVKEPAAEGYTVEAGEAGNPYDELFERVVFSPADSDRVFENKNGTSKRLANVMIVLRGGFASTPGSVYARKINGRAKPVVEVVLFGTQQQTAIKPHDEQSKAHLLDWRRRATERFIKWREANPVTTGAKRQQAAIELDGLDF